MVATTKAGYMQMYNLVLEEKNGYVDFSGSKNNKEIWAQQKLENERELLKRMIHEKQVSVFSSAAALNGK